MKIPKEYAEELVGKHFVIMTNDLSFDRKRAITHAKIDVQNTIDVMKTMPNNISLHFLNYFEQILFELENL